jgi:hypothetical protein
MAEENSEKRIPSAIRTIGEQSEKISKKLWFLDLKFTQFFTPKLIGFVFVLFILTTVIGLVCVGVYVVLALPLLQAIFVFIVEAIIFVVLAICLRVFLETFLVLFRIAEHLSYLRYLEKD